MIRVIMQTTPFDTSNATSTHSGQPVNVEIVIGQSGAAYITYDQPFNKPLSWFEYDVATSRLEFVMEDGELRNFGIPVARDIAPHLIGAHILTFAYIHEDELLDAQELPLIVHGV